MAVRQCGNTEKNLLPNEDFHTGAPPTESSTGSVGPMSPYPAREGSRSEENALSEISLRGQPCARLSKRSDPAVTEAASVVSALIVS